MFLVKVSEGAVRSSKDGLRTSNREVLAIGKGLRMHFRGGSASVLWRLKHLKPVG